MKGLIKSMSYADKYVTNQKNLSKISKESSITPINQTKKSIQFNNTDKIDTKTPSTSRNEKIFNKPITPKKGSTPLDTWSHSDLSQSEIGDQLDELNVSINLENLNINEPQHNNQKVEAQFKSNSNQAFRHPAFNPQFNSKLKSKSKKLGNETSQRHVNKESNPTVSETESKYGDLVKVKSLPQLPAAIVSNSPVIPDCPETSSSASNSYLSESSTSISDQSEKYQHQHQQQHQHQHQSPQFKHKSLNVELVETEIQKLEHEIGFNSVLNTTTDNKLVTNTINIESIQRDPKCQSNSNETKARRKVEYTPCSLEEYRLTKPREYVEITPKLRPDLNTDELLAKRANMQRIKDFANQLKAHNKAVQDPTKRTLEAEKQRQLEIARNFQQSKVAKAAEFAKHVPKPKRVSNEVVSINSIRSNQPNVVASTRGTSKINSSSSAYRDKYLAHGFLNQHESCRHSLLADDYVSNDDDDEENRGFKIYGKDSNFQSKSIDPRINQHLPTRLELLESKYRESQRQIESIKQSFRK